MTRTLSDESSALGDVPEGWMVRTVLEMGEVLTGKALAVNAPGRQRPYLRTKNVFDGRIDIDDVLTMPMTDEQFVQFQLRRGDILLNEGQSLELVGRCALYSGEYPEPCAIQNQLIRFRARRGVNADFASYLFRRCQQTGVFARIALQTTSIAHLGGSRFGRLRLAWPKREEEQCAIAGALSDVDALLVSLSRLIAKKRDLKQASVQQLLAGQTRLPAFSGDWEAKRLGAISSMKSGVGITSEAIDNHAEYPCYGGNGTRGFTSRYTHSGRYALVGRQGALCGNVIGVEGSFFASEHAIVVTAFPGTNIQWLTYVLRDMNLNQHTESSAQPGLSVAKILNLEVQFPLEQAEQTAIAAVLSDMDAELDGLEQRRAKTAALKQGMMQELLTGRTRLV
ncbi:MAG: hsdS [Polaromonas sp.]|nr:hsdS [Polaromonas sp.]